MPRNGEEVRDKLEPFPPELRGDEATCLVVDRQGEGLPATVLSLTLPSHMPPLVPPIPGSSLPLHPRTGLGLDRCLSLACSRCRLLMHCFSRSDTAWWRQGYEDMTDMKVLNDAEVAENLRSMYQNKSAYVTHNPV